MIRWRKIVVLMVLLLVVAVPIGFGAVAVFGPDWGPMIATVVGVVLGPLLVQYLHVVDFD